MSEFRVAARLDIPPRGSADRRLRLLQGFELTAGGRSLELPPVAQRLVALLGLLNRPLHRLYIAGVLWPDSTERHSYGSLRSALWRLHRADPTVVAGSDSRIALASDIRVDLHELIDRLHQFVGHPEADGEAAITLAELSHELLPDWYDDWLAIERERLRQLQLHALEALSRQLRGQGQFAGAIEAAQLAVAAEPTRESARRELIEAHLAEGNVGEALRQFKVFRSLLAAELGVEPSGRLVALMPERVPHGSQ